MRIKVVNVSLHAAIAIPGFISTEKTLNSGKVKGIEMWLTPMGLYLEAPCKDGKITEIKKAIIPSANVAIVVFEKDETLEPKVKAKA